QGVKHVVDRANVLFAIMVHAKAATPFGFQGEQDDPFADFKFRVRFVMGMTRPQILEDLLDGLLDEGTSVCQRSFKHGQDLGLVDVRQILAGLAICLLSSSLRLTLRMQIARPARICRTSTRPRSWP